MTVSPIAPHQHLVSVRHKSRRIGSGLHVAFRFDGGQQPKGKSLCKSRRGCGIAAWPGGKPRPHEGYPMRTIRAITLFLGALTLVASAQAQVLIRITTPPPPLPVYVQPVI